MMRPIDAYALIAEMHKVIFEDGEDRSICYEVIERQPTIEVAKVAQWMEDGYGNGEIVCSNCGEPCATFSMLKPRDRYCKWCGAKMEGERG